jgi:hypothetical protein
MGELIPTQEILLIYTQEHMVAQSSLVIARCGTRIQKTDVDIYRANEKKRIFLRK